MSVKKRIQDNLYADETVDWVVANVAKFVIETALAAITTVPLFLAVYAGILSTKHGLPFGAAGPVGLYLLLAAGGYREFWNCRLSPAG